MSAAQGNVLYFPSKTENIWCDSAGNDSTIANSVQGVAGYGSVSLQKTISVESKVPDEEFVYINIGGGSGGDGMDGKISKLQSDISRIDGAIEDIKGSINRFGGYGIGIAGIIVAITLWCFSEINGNVTSTFGLLDDKVTTLIKDVSRIETDTMNIKNAASRSETKLDTISTDINKITHALEMQAKK